MYTVIGLPLTRTARVLWALEELGQEYRLNPVSPATPEAKAINPSGKVPVLIDGDFQLTDSTAIMMHLADKHGGLLAEVGTPERARQYEMIGRLLDELDAVLWANSRHKIILPEHLRVPEIRNSVAFELQRNTDRLAEQMTGPYLAGEMFSIADIIFSHCIGWAKSAQIEITNPVILNHAKTMRERPAFQKVLALLK